MALRVYKAFGDPKSVLRRVSFTPARFITNDPRRLRNYLMETQTVTECAPSLVSVSVSL